MLKVKEYVVGLDNKVRYINDEYDGEVRTYGIKWDSDLQDFKFKNKAKIFNQNDDELFKFRSYDVEEAWQVAMLLKEMQYDRCQDCDGCQ